MLEHFSWFLSQVADDVRLYKLGNKTNDINKLILISQLATNRIRVLKSSTDLRSHQDIA